MERPAEPSNGEFYRALPEDQRTHIKGAPSLVVEILSPSSYRHDWIVNADPGTLEVLLWDAESYRVAGSFKPPGRFRSPTLPDLDLDAQAIFAPSGPRQVDEVREAAPEYITVVMARMS